MQARKATQEQLRKIQLEERQFQEHRKAALIMAARQAGKDAKIRPFVEARDKAQEEFAAAQGKARDAHAALQAAQQALDDNLEALIPAELRM